MRIKEVNCNKDYEVRTGFMVQEKRRFVPLWKDDLMFEDRVGAEDYITCKR